MRVMLACTLLLAACTWQLQVGDLTDDGGAPPDAPADAALADDAAERPAPPPPLDPALQQCDGYPTVLMPLDGEAGVARDAAREQLRLATGASIALWTTGDVSQMFDVNAALAVRVGDSPEALDVGLRAFFGTWQEAFGFTLDPLATTFAGATSPPRIEVRLRSWGTEWLIWAAYLDVLRLPPVVRACERLDLAQVHAAIVGTPIPGCGDLGSTWLFEPNDIAVEASGLLLCLPERGCATDEAPSIRWAWQVSVGQAGAPKVYLDGATGQILMVVQSCI
ncbi:MAG TPA: hypothetical protein VGQ83_35835 [Polyangia bacterium]|jgi:hypothetical protein